MLRRLLSDLQYYLRSQLRYLIESADVDDNYFIDKDEFLSLIQKHSGQLEKIQQNNFLKYMRIAAYADEFRYLFYLFKKLNI